MPTKGDKVSRRVGETFTVKFGLSDNGVAATGKAGTMTVTVYDETGTSFATPTVTETPASSGIYSYSLTPDAVGLWTARLVETSIPAFTAWAWDIESTVTNDVLVNLKHQVSGVAPRRNTAEQGSTFYWDPTNGNDSNDGLTPQTAKVTFSSVYGLATAGAHDTIVLLADSGSALVTITAQIDLNKSHTTLLGPGRAVTFIPTSTTGVTVTLSAEACSIRRLRVETATTGGTADGVLISAADCTVEDCWVEDCQDEGIIVRGSAVSGAVIRRVRVRDVLGEGILIDGLTAAINNVLIEDCEIDAAGNNGVQLLGSTNPITESVVRRIYAFDCGGRGVVEGTGCSDNAFDDIRGANNTLGLLSINSSTSRDFSAVPPLVSGVADSGSTTTLVDTARTEADTDYWKGAWIRFTSGNVAGQVRLITAFNAGTDTITFAPALTQAVGTHNYEILAAGAVDVGLWRASLPNVLIAGRVDADVGAMQVNTVTAAALAADASAEIADAVWDEDIVAAHGGADSSGEVLSQLTKRAATLGTEVLDGSVIGQILDDGTATYDRTTDSLQALRDEPFEGPTAQQVATEVWSEALPGTFGAGEAGERLATTDDRVDVVLSTRASQASVDVIDANVDDLVAATILAELTVGTGSSTTEIRTNATQADDFFNNAMIVVINAAGAAVRKVDDYANTNGAFTVTALPFTPASGNPAYVIGRVAAAAGGSSPTAAEIADAVWDEDIVAAHGTADTAGETLSQLTKRSVTFSSEVVAGSVLRQLADDGTATFDRATDSLQAIRDRGDAAWTEPTGQEIRDAMKLAPSGGAPAAGSVDQHLDDIEANTVTLLSRITATLFTGITSLAQWLGLLAGKQVGNATARTEIQATGAGSGTFDETTDALEAIRDRGDAAWDTAVGFAVPGDAMDLVANAVDAAALDASAVAEIQTGLATAAALAVVAAEVNKTLHRTCNRVDLDPGNGTMTVYNDAGAAEFTALAYMDVAQTQLYDGTGPVHSIRRLT